MSLFYSKCCAKLVKHVRLWQIDKPIHMELICYTDLNNPN